MRKIHPTSIWEIRVGLDLRAVFRVEKDVVEFRMVGNHNDVLRYLKSL